MSGDCGCLSFPPPASVYAPHLPGETRLGARVPWQGRRPCAGEEWSQSRRETPLPAAASLWQRQLCAPQGQGWPLRQARDPARANDGWRLKGGIPESPPCGRPPRACERERGHALAGVRRGPLAAGGGGGAVGPALSWTLPGRVSESTETRWREGRFTVSRPLLGPHTCLWCVCVLEGSPARSAHGHGEAGRADDRRAS